jgi:puromycin-sensitive aminopeptidase
MQPDYRLPESVVPRRYEITLDVDPDQESFSGEETVDVEVTKPARELVLNAAGLEVSGARLDSASGVGVDGQVELDEAEQRLIVRLSNEAAPGSYQFRCRFRGRLGDKLTGLYRSTFSDNGSTRAIAATQFEATYARQAFPCWDEPDKKAVFSLSLVVPDQLLAISNAGVAAEERLAGGRRRVRFADTMPMSTYLVAAVVGPLEATEAVLVDGIPLRVVHRPGQERLARFALEVGAHALQFFTAWFGIPYPADKLDLIALPDFAYGAMENLGAVTFREALLLVDPEAASRTELQQVADVICHEIAHMWFGDLVTMKWWNGIWLNEAFATYMELLCCDAFRPEWERWVDFGRDRQVGMAIDGLSSTRPIEYPVGRPEECAGMFDPLTYQKGAGVLRMLEQYLGTERFQAGIRRYLQAHRHGNAETTDLWDAIEEASGEPVRAVMDSFIFQGGHPSVAVAKVEEGVRLEQSPFRYRSLGEGAGADAIGREWRVPVVVRAGFPDGSSATCRLLLSSDPATVDIGSVPSFVVGNDGGWGVYRTRYSGDLWAGLLGALDHLGPLERYSALSDVWAHTLAGRAGLAEVAGLLRALSGEDDPTVCAEVAGILSMLELVAGDEGRLAVHSFTRALLGPALERLSFEPSAGEGPKVPTLRSVLVRALGTTGADPAVRQRVAQLHREVLSGERPADPDLAGAMASVVAVTGGEAEFEAFVERFRHPANPQEQLRYLYALGEFSEPALVERALELARTEVRSQNAPFLVQRALANHKNGQRAWEFVKSHWEELLERLPDNTIVRMLEPVAGLCQPAQAADVRRFFAAHAVPQGQRSLDQILERLEVNVAFAQREGPRLADTLVAIGA